MFTGEEKLREPLVGPGKKEMPYPTTHNHPFDFSSNQGSTPTQGRPLRSKRNCDNPLQHTFVVSASPQTCNQRIARHTS